MLSDEAHFGAGCGCGTLDLVPDRLDQGDAGHEDGLLVILQIIFGSMLTEEPALGDETAADSNSYSCSRQDHATSCGAETDDRAYPIKLRCGCRCTRKRPYGGPASCDPESRYQGGDTSHRSNTGGLADHSVHKYPSSFFGILPDCRDDRI